MTGEQQWRIDELARPEHFDIDITSSPVLYHNLSKEEYARLKRKLLFVQTSAKRLCAGMVKGAIKYDELDGTWNLKQWFEFLREEADDFVNYISLMEQEIEKASTNNS